MVRLFHFLKSCGEELGRMRWPNRQQLGQGIVATLVVIVIFGALMGGADALFGAAADMLVDAFTDTPGEGAVSG